MAPVIILIRHGEALHNIDDDWTIPDPGLTSKGVEQCRAMAAELEPRFTFTPDECRIVVSPLTRTLQTVHHGLQWLLSKGVPTEVRAEWQETTDLPCDVGRELSTIQSEWPGFDFSHLDPTYPQKIGLYENSEEAFHKRASVAKRWLFGRPEKCIVVVTHSGFLKRVVQGPKFKNMEYKTYELVKHASEESLELREIDGQKPLKQS
ncbi:histidine phosphatase superfamily [Xylariaceae sp. FL0662B]|nr:histidine phosphatase superfamily [Xylariaceae sp. FL0662B]